MKRAVLLIYKLEPFFYVLELLRAIISALLPISAVYFSAAIVTELSEGKRVNVLSGWVIASVITLFLLFSLKSVLDLKSKSMEEQFQLKFATYLNSRFALLDYPYTEQQEILSLFRKVMSNHFALGGGVLRVYRFIPVLMNSLAGLMMSMLLLKGMFDNALEGQPQKGMGSISGILLLVFIVLGIILNAGVGVHFQKKIFKLMEELPNSNHMVGYYEEYLSPAKAGKDIRIYNQKDYILNIFKNRFGGIPLFIGESNATSWQVGIASVTISILNIMVYLLIGLRALYGWYPIGGVVQYVGAVNNLIVTLSQFSSVVTSLWTNQKFLKDQFSFLDLKTLPEEEACQEMIHPAVIEFHDVSFQYPGAKTWALRHLNLKIEGNGRIAVVGQNGSGKTTMVKLLCRLYEPTEGRITINGKDIFEFPNADYRRMLSPVFQDFMLPSLPIGQIIACGVDYDKEKVKQCLAKAGLSEKIAGLPMGLDTPLNHEVFPEGTSLSGGEMQKLAIARSIYKDAAIMVLDEPTSALDPISEYEIYSQFDKIVSDKMAIYVSHRLSSCKFCDRIFVFGNGKLMGEGTHEELFLGKNEIYCKLWNAQSQYYQE